MFLYRFVRRRRCRPQILVHAITFEQLFGFLSFWHDVWPRPIDYLIRFWSIFVVTLTLNFQGQIWNLLYLSQIWCDCHGTKSKHIDSSQGLKCNHWVWPWQWPWIVKVKYGISHISVKNGAIAKERKANILIHLKASNVTIGFDLGHDLDLELSRSNMEFAISQPKVAWLPQNEKQTYWLNSRPQMWPMGLNLDMTLTFEFSRSNYDLDHLVTEVRCKDLPSDVGVPSTHLVIFYTWHYIWIRKFDACQEVGFSKPI